MDIVTQLLTAEGWTVSDVGATHSYDLHCSSVEEEELYVEVKGTTGPLSSIPLTASEVALARSLHPATALFVVHDITLGGSPEEPVAAGGHVHSVRPWRPDDERLVPTAFSYGLL